MRKPTVDDTGARSAADRRAVAGSVHLGTRAALAGRAEQPDEAATFGRQPRSRDGARQPATRVAAPSAPLPSGTGPGARVRPAAPGRARTERHAVPRRRPRWPVILVGLVVVLLTIGLGAYGVVNAGFFRVGRVEVKGASLVAADDIVRATGATGKQLFQVDPAAVRTRVEQLPGIQRAEVRRVWPRRLVVTVTERVPVAVWQVGGVTYTVDGDGVVLDLTPGPSLLTIYQLDGAPGLAPGDRVDGDTVRLATRLRDVAPARVGRQITRFEWTQGAGLEVTTDRGERVRFGDGANLDYKLAVWRALMDQARKDKREVREIDLRFEDRVVYR